MKPPAEISRIIVVRRETMEDSLEWNNISIVDAGGVRKAIAAKRIAEIVVQVARNNHNRRVFHGEETSERACTYASGFANSCPVSHLATFGTASERGGRLYTRAHIHVYIYIFRRAKKFLLSTIVTRHRIRIACVPERRSFARLK